MSERRHVAFLWDVRDGTGYSGALRRVPSGALSRQIDPDHTDRRAWTPPSAGGFNARHGKQIEASDNSLDSV